MLRFSELDACLYGLWLEGTQRGDVRGMKEMSSACYV